MGNDLVNCFKVGNASSDVGTVVESPRSALIYGAKEDFTRGNAYFKEAKIENAKESYRSALEKLYHWCENIEIGERSDSLPSLDVNQFTNRRLLAGKQLIQSIISHHKYVNLLADSEIDVSLCSLAIVMTREDVFEELSPEEEQDLQCLRDQGSADCLIADIQNNIGVCCELTADLNKACESYQNSLCLREVIYGQRSIKVAESMHNLSTVLETQGNFGRASDVLAQALAIEEHIHGKNHIETAASLNNLGVLSAHLGQFAAAAKLLQRSYHIRTKAHGRGHHLTSCAKHNLDYVKIQLEHQQAAATQQEAVAAV